MNIFYISDNPVQAAEWMVDRHVVKMILESAQLLSTAHRVLDGLSMVDTSGRRKKTIYVIPDMFRDINLYSATHVNHPSAIWARESISNYLWLHRHAIALLDEYTYRYKKVHKCDGLIRSILSNPPDLLKKTEFTQMPSCMAPEYIISDDPIENYRNYYREGKKHIHSWKNRAPPYWI